MRGTSFSCSAVQLYFVGLGLCILTVGPGGTFLKFKRTSVTRLWDQKHFMWDPQVGNVLIGQVRTNESHMGLKNRVVPLLLDSSVGPARDPVSS